MKKTASPTREPAVPGATGEYPLPNPVARAFTDHVRHLFLCDIRGSLAYSRKRPDFTHYFWKPEPLEKEKM